MATGERIEKVTREQNEVLMVHPIAGGERAEACGSPFLL
jgi:hypothetical protein